MMDQKRIENAHVWAGMHGEEDEPGLPLVDSLKQSPLRIAGAELTAAVMHPLAVALRRRYLDVDLSKCLADPSAYSGTVEAALVPQIVAISKGKDFVGDMHTQKFGEKDYAYLGPRFRHYMLGFIALTGMREVILAQMGVHGLLPQGVTVDIAPASHRNRTGYWRDILATMLTDGLPTPQIDKFTFYAHDNVSGEMRKAAGIMSGKVYEPFAPLPNLRTQFGTTPLALYGCDAEYDGPLEAITPLTPSQIKVKDGIAMAPSLDIEVG